MKEKITAIFLAVFFLHPVLVQAQEAATGKNYHNFPIIVSIQFQNFALPFHDLGSNFSHIGLALGTEVSLNGKQNWAQRFEVGTYLNKEAGNGFFVYTQTVYRPTLFNDFYAEIKAGLGWQRAFHPVESYQFKNDQWVSAKGGKSQLIVPLAVSLGYSKYREHTYVSPYVTYQVIPALYYNDGIPLNFYSLFQLGARIHINYQ